MRDLATKARNGLPSRPVAVGVLGGGGLAPLLIWVLDLFGIPVPPEIAASIGSLLGGLFGYTVKGGRKG